MILQAPSTPSPEMDSCLRRELLPGEHLLWSGCPAPHKLRRSFASWVFALPWTVFALFQASQLLPLTGIALQSFNPGEWIFGIFLTLFLVPFIAVGFVMLWEPFKVLRNAERTIYGLTDRRVLRVLAGATLDSTSLLFRKMGTIGVRADAKGYGTLRITIGATCDSQGVRKVNSFELPGVPDVARLKDLLTDQLAKARSEGERH
jgi:hypothetical protein